MAGILFLVVVVVVFIGYTKRKAQQNTSGTAIQSSDRYKKKITAVQFLGIVGLVSIVYGIDQRPPAYSKLTSIKARITRIATVSRREEGNEAQSPSSVNPFKSNNWLQLTVEPINPAVGVGDSLVWKVNTILTEDELDQLHNAIIVAAVKNSAPRSEAYEVKREDGREVASYTDTTRGAHTAFMLFVGLGSIALLASLIVFLTVRKETSSQSQIA